LAHNNLFGVVPFRPPAEGAAVEIVEIVEMAVVDIAADIAVVLVVGMEDMCEQEDPPPVVG